VAKQRFREVRVHVQDYIIMLIAGACLGFLSNMKDANLGSQGYIFTITAIGEGKEKEFNHIKDLQNISRNKIISENLELFLINESSHLFVSKWEV
jgi:hypothetical protein